MLHRTAQRAAVTANRRPWPAAYQPGAPGPALLAQCIHRLSFARRCAIHEKTNLEPLLILTGQGEALGYIRS
jgi:hypothetical protein